MKHFYLLLLLCVGTTAFGQWTANTAANLEIAALNAADLQVATTAEGKTWVAWYTNTGSNYDMRAQLLDRNGNKLLGSDGILVCSQPSGSAIYVFNICLDAAGNLIVGFQYQVSGTNTAAVTKVSTNGTLLWGTGGVTLTAGLSPYVAVLTTGETVVAWNNNSPATLYLQKLNEAGVPVWATPVAVQVGTTNTTRGQIVPMPNGDFTLVFQRRGVGINTTLFSQRYNNSGVAQWPAPVQLSNLATAGTRYYSVQAEGDTTYVGYYAASGSRFRSYVQRINPDGTLPWAINGSLFSDYSTGSEPYQQTTNMAKTPGSPYLWAVCTYSNTGQSQYGVYVQKFDKVSGARLLNVYGKEVFPISTNTSQQTGTLNLAGDAPLFMYYNKEYKISAVRLDAAGNFVWPGDSVLLSATTATLGSPKGRFAFGSMVNGRAVAVWTENRGIENRAYAQDVTATGTTGVLPVKLGTFAAKRAGEAVVLAWTTFSETANKGFYAERSRDGSRFTTVGFSPTLAAGGNSSVQLNYSLADTKPTEGVNYYRLRQVDQNGKEVYSSVVPIAFAKDKNRLLYPNPVTDAVTVHFSAGNTRGLLTVYDNWGQAVIQKKMTGELWVRVDTKGLPSGNYRLVLSGDGGREVQTESFIKQ